MKKTNTLKMIVAFLFLLLFLFNSYGQKFSEWKGTIEVEDGVTIVKNPKEPMYGKDVFYLEEELKIGERNGREEHMFSRLSQLVINDRGDIYALDILENHIKMFNEKGESNVYIFARNPKSLDFELNKFDLDLNFIKKN